jgi:broad specificity phosphatase PhoE
MGETTTVHVLRHGEVYNPQGILYGRMSGFGLSDTGKAQAEALAEALAGNDVALVVASPLQRAQETAAPIAARHGLEVATDPDLTEAANFFAGKNMGSGALRDPRVWWQLRNPFRPSWGEPYAEVAARMTTALGKARAKAAGHEAVLVSHQLPIWTLRRHLSGRHLWHDPRRRQCALASDTSFVFDGDKLVGIHYCQPAGS